MTANLHPPAEADLALWLQERAPTILRQYGRYAAGHADPMDLEVYVLAHHTDVYWMWRGRRVVIVEPPAA